MKKLFKILMILIIIIITVTVAKAQTTTIFFDDFNGSKMNSLLWHIPTWVSSSDGTYVGRTQFRCSQNASLPSINNSQAVINVESYNPTGFSFYGTDLISNKAFTPGKGLIITVHAKIKAPTAGGIVGGIYLYDLTGAGSIHDEIDFELITNKLNEVQTNIYSDESLGGGHPDFASIVDPITEYHTYVIEWLPNEVSWIVDEKVIRTNTDRVPTGPMHFNLNMWVPGIEWSAAYNASLQPTNVVSSNQIFSMIVDSVRIDSLIDMIPTSIIEKQEAEINFYPNPAHGLIYFTALGKINVSIYNVAGNMILNKKEITGGSLSIAGFPPGLYIIRYEQNNIVGNAKKLIIY